MMKVFSAVIATIYVMGALIGALLAFAALNSPNIEPWLEANKIAAYCIISGLVGGCLYCLRGIYLNYCVNENWDATWLPWYFIRPVASCVAGFASYLLVSAGLIILEATPNTDASNYGLFLFCFIGGLNVDKLVKKLEDFAFFAWGIERSRAQTMPDGNSK